MAQRLIYGWIDHDKAFLSPFPPTRARRPLNWYDSREEAEAEAAQRRCIIEWEQ